MWKKEKTEREIWIVISFYGIPGSVSTGGKKFVSLVPNFIDTLVFMLIPSSGVDVPSIPSLIVICLFILLCSRNGRKKIIHRMQMVQVTSYPATLQSSSYPSLKSTSWEYVWISLIFSSSLWLYACFMFHTVHGAVVQDGRREHGNVGGAI